MIIFIIPAYNEEKNIPTLLKEIEYFAKNYKCRIIIVNDGSTDKTKEIVTSFKNKLSVEVLTHLTNKGPGEAFKTGFSYVLREAKEEDIIITKEADNTGDDSILPVMIEKILEGNNLVIASCYARNGQIIGTTLIRKILSYTANTFLRILYPHLKVKTYSSFYRAYSVKLLKKAYKTYGEHFIKEKGFIVMTEILIKLSRLKEIKLVEVPTILKCDERLGKSKMKVIKNILDYIRFIIKDTFNQ
ncbi:MAG: glycosyltransferase [bacterium]|nr:glycosyltransferase [bacterium]